MGIRLIALTSGRSNVFAAEHEQRQQHGLRDHVRARAAADRRRGPQRGRGVEAPDIHALFHDRPGTEKAYSRDHIGNHANAALGSVEAVCKIDKRGSADRDQHIGSQTGAVLAILPFGTDQRSQHEGGQQTDQRVEKVIELKSLNETHGWYRSGIRRLRKLCRNNNRNCFGMYRPAAIAADHSSIFRCEGQVSTTSSLLRAVHDRRFQDRICSGVSLGEPCPAASALLISVTTRRDSGTSSPRRSAIAVMTPCR